MRSPSTPRASSWRVQWNSVPRPRPSPRRKPCAWLPFQEAPAAPAAAHRLSAASDAPFPQAPAQVKLARAGGQARAGSHVDAALTRLPVFERALRLAVHVLYGLKRPDHPVRVRAGRVRPKCVHVPCRPARQLRIRRARRGRGARTVAGRGVAADVKRVEPRVVEATPAQPGSGAAHRLLPETPPASSGQGTGRGVRDAACPIGTGSGTRRVHLVRGGGRRAARGGPRRRGPARLPQTAVGAPRRARTPAEARAHAAAAGARAARARPRRACEVPARAREGRAPAPHAAVRGRAVEPPREGPASPPPA